MSSLHSNYNTRCMAERAKDLVRHPSAAAREWVGRGGRSGVVSTSQVGCVSVFLCLVGKPSFNFV